MVCSNCKVKAAADTLFELIMETVEGIDGESNKIQPNDELVTFEAESCFVLRGNRAVDLLDDEILATLIDARNILLHGETKTVTLA